MPELIKERCLYCGGDVYYHSRQKLIKCEWCGETINTVKFENVLVRMQETEEENAQIKQRLAKAEKEKETANDRLFSALSALGQIRDDQDVLGQMLHLLTGNQNDALGSLQFLKEISKRLIGSQNDIFARMTVVQDIASQIQKIDMDAQERQTVMSQFMLWSQQTQEEDLQRLQEIAASSDQLLQETQEIHAKVNDLREKSSHLQQTIDAFHTEYTRDKLQELQQLYHQAADFQHDLRFDTAEEYYHNVVTKGGADAEVYWRLIMCHYCLFYEKDDTGRLIPIILNPDLTDPAEMSLRKELDALMTAEDRPYYTTKLQEIDRILDKYRLLKGEVRYDIFISVKQDDNGHYTADSDVASDLYDFLKKQGLRVFNSRRTAIPAGHEYEPYIISALLSSKVLIVVGTSPENMLSNWVKNEWSRFQWLQYRDKEKTGKTDRVLFCYLAKGMQAEQIPRALHPDRQAIYDGVKAHDELLAGISFLKVYKGGSGSHNLLLDFRLVADQMKFWLIQGKYDRVLSKYNELTETGLFLSQAQLHLLALCAEKQVIDIQQVVCSEVILDEEKEFKAAIMLCRSDEEKEKLKELLAKNQEWRGRTEIVEEEKESETQKQDDKEQTSESDEATKWLRLGLDAELNENYSDAIQWYRKAAGQGIAEAQYRLGLCYENGNGIRKNRKTAVNWYKKAAELGFAEANNHLGFCYENGICVTADITEAIKFYQKAADQGSEQSKKKLYQIHISEHGTSDDWYHLGKEAEDKHNASEAEKWYLKAAEADHIEAQFALGLLYFNNDGKSPWLKRHEARTWFRRAAEQGHADACYYTGYLEEPISYKEAIKWYREAADKNVSEAQYRLGRCYDYGIGVTKNEKLAEKWYQKAINQGNEHAKENLLLLKQSKEGSPDDWYRIGKRAEQNKMYQEAVAWYKKAANAGHADAQMALAFCYKDGLGVPRKNDGLFREWANKGMNQCTDSFLRNRYADYLFKEGCKYEDSFRGKLSMFDRKLAKACYQKAATLGHKEAKQKLSRLFW